MIQSTEYLNQNERRMTATIAELRTEVAILRAQSSARAEHILELIEQVAHLEADKRELERQLAAALAACQACREEKPTQ